MDTSSNTSKLKISPLWLSGCGIVLWVSLAFLLNSAQPGDNIEQLVWASEFAWGYDKHPPFSTWLLIAAQNLFGKSPYLTYVLAVICNVVTMYCMYKIAIEILDQETAIWVILILSLTYSFTRKAQYYNHNTVMLLGLSLTSLLTVYALRLNRWWNWTLLGFSAGALVLTKYQSFVGLALVGLILVRWQGVNHLKGEVIAIACMILVLTPHGEWLITNKGASPLEYALVTLNPNPSTDQLKGLASYLLGLIKQYFLFALFMLGAWIWRLKENERQAAVYQSISPFATSVMLHLTVGRALLMVLIALAGVRLQDHWAMPLALFMSLPIACYTSRLIGPLKNRHLNSLFFVQAIAVGFFTLQNLGYLKQQNEAHIERHLSVDNIVTATQKH